MPSSLSHSFSAQYQILATSILKRTQDEWSLSDLPLAAQVSPVFGIVSHDFNKDGLQDIFLTGNLFSVKPEVGRIDANSGILLKGMGKLIFEPVHPSLTGVVISGEVRDMEIFYDASGEATVLVAKNNDLVQWIKGNK